MSESKKTVLYVCATENGELPAQPKKSADACQNQMPICQKFKPGVKWKIFEIERVTTYDGKGVRKRVESVDHVVRNADKALADRIFSTIAERYQIYFERLAKA